MLKERCDRVGTGCTVQIIGGEKPKLSSGESLTRIFAK